MLAGDFNRRQKPKLYSNGERQYSFSSPLIIEYLQTVLSVKRLLGYSSSTSAEAGWKASLFKLLSNWPVFNVLPGCLAVLALFRLHFMAPLLLLSVSGVLAVQRMYSSRVKTELLFGTIVALYLTLFSSVSWLCGILVEFGFFLNVLSRWNNVSSIATVLAFVHIGWPDSQLSSSSHVISLLASINLTCVVSELAILIDQNADWIDSTLARLFGISVPEKPQVFVKLVTPYSIELGWSSSSSAVMDYLEFLVYMNGSLLTGTRKRGMVVKDLRPDCVYRFQVAAVQRERKVTSDVLSVKTKVAAMQVSNSIQLQSLDDTISALKATLQNLSQSLVNVSDLHIGNEVTNQSRISGLSDKISNVLRQENEMKQKIDQKLALLNDAQLQQSVLKSDMSAKKNDLQLEYQGMKTEIELCNTRLFVIKESVANTELANKQLESEILMAKGEAFDYSNNNSLMVREIDRMASQARELYANEQELERRHQLAMEDIDVLQRQLRLIISEKQQQSVVMSRSDYSPESNDDESIDDILNAVDLDRMNDLYPSVKHQPRLSTGNSNKWNSELASQSTVGLTPRKPSSRLMETRNSNNSSMWFSNPINNSFQEYRSGSLFMSSPFCLFDADVSEDKNK